MFIAMILLQYKEVFEILNLSSQLAFREAQLLS